jgi:hypothetical protein
LVQTSDFKLSIISNRNSKPPKMLSSVGAILNPGNAKFGVRILDLIEGKDINHV